MLKPNFSFDKKEFIFHLALIIGGIWLILVTHLGIDISWLNSDDIYIEDLVHSLVVEHGNFFHWELTPSTHLLVTPILFVMSFFTKNVHYWIIASMVLKTIWLYIGTVYLCQLISPSQQKRLYAGTLVFCFYVLASVLFMHHNTFRLFWSLPGDGRLAYSEVLMPLTALCLSISYLKAPHLLKIITLGLVCVASAFASILFMVAFTAPFVLLYIAKMPIDKNQVRLAIVILSASLLGFAAYQACVFVFDNFRTTPIIWQPPSYVLDFFLQPFRVSILLGLAHYGAILIIITRTMFFQKTLSKTQLIVFQFFCIMFLVNTAAIFVDHDISPLYSSRVHYQFLWYLSFLLAIDSPPIWASCIAAILICLGTYPLWSKKPNYDLFFKPSRDVVCLENLVKEQHLHSGLTRFWLSRPYRLESNWRLSLANNDDRTFDKPYLWADNVDNFVYKHFDYYIAKSTDPLFVYDDSTTMTQLVGKPDGIFTCPNLTIYVYRQGQLSAYNYDRA